jgi:hypothetical protein
VIVSTRAEGLDYHAGMAALESARKIMNNQFSVGR